jgi:predicted nucleic acid-binding protein
MNSIVADTGPLNYLVLIQAIEILPNLYEGVSIPPAVLDELSHPRTPDLVRAWISRPPSWLRVVALKERVDSSLSALDAGEREAISLAWELHAHLLLMDERDGVFLARKHGLDVIGTLAVLDLAAGRGLVDLQTMFDRLLAIVSDSLEKSGLYHQGHKYPPAGRPNAWAKVAPPLAGLYDQLDAFQPINASQYCDSRTGVPGHRRRY